MIDMNSRKEVVQKLKELNEKDLPRMTIESMNTIDGINIRTDDISEIKEINDYLSSFYDYTKGENGNKCLFTEQTPQLRWGIAHGVAIDNNTGLSWKHYHFLTTNGKRQRYDLSLQYHPSVYEIEEETD